MTFCTLKLYLMLLMIFLSWKFDMWMKIFVEYELLDVEVYDFNSERDSSRPSPLPTPQLIADDLFKIL